MTQFAADGIFFSDRNSMTYNKYFMHGSKTMHDYHFDKIEGAAKIFLKEFNNNHKPLKKEIEISLVANKICVFFFF